MYSPYCLTQVKCIHCNNRSCLCVRILHCRTVAVSCLVLSVAAQQMHYKLCIALFKTLFSRARLFPTLSSRAVLFRNRNSSRAFHCTWDRRENGASPKSILYRRRLFDPSGSANGIVNSSNFRCQTIKRYGNVSLSCFPKLWCFWSYSSRAWTSPRPSSETRRDIDLPVRSEKYFQNL